MILISSNAKIQTSLTWPKQKSTEVKLHTKCYQDILCGMKYDKSNSALQLGRCTLLTILTTQDGVGALLNLEAYQNCSKARLDSSALVFHVSGKVKFFITNAK